MYRLYDWNGNKKAEVDGCLKTAVKTAITLGCEVHDDSGDIIFSQWDGWNGDYPGVENIWYPAFAE